MTDTTPTPAEDFDLLAILAAAPRFSAEPVRRDGLFGETEEEFAARRDAAFARWHNFG